MKQLIILLILLSCQNIYGQSPKYEYPIVGKPMPEFELTDLVNYSKKSAKLKDFKGKWLILDFWGYSCSSCISSFPKMNELSKKYSDKIKIVMVGATKSGFGNTEKTTKITKNLYQILNNKYSLTLTTAFDSVLFLKYQVGPLPYIVIVGPDGLVKAKTSFINEDNIKSIIKGDLPILTPYFNIGERESTESFNQNALLLTSGNDANGGIDTGFLYRSLITKWNHEMPLNQGSAAELSLDEHGRFEWWGSDLNTLVRIATSQRYTWSVSDSLYKVFSQYPVLLLKDSSLFADEDQATGRNLYSYSLKVSPYKVSINRLKKIMQRDLENAFNIKISIEQVELPVWKIILIDKEKIMKLKSTRSGKWIGGTIAPYEGYWYEGIPVSQLASTGVFDICLFDRYNHKGYRVPPVIDGTGLDLKVDIQIQAFMKDYNDVRSALNKYGLDLVLTKGLLNAAVVRDSFQ